MSAGAGDSVKLSQQRGGREVRGCMERMSEDSVGIAGWQGATSCSRPGECSQGWSDTFMGPGHPKLLGALVTQVTRCYHCQK